MILKTDFSCSSRRFIQPIIRRPMAARWRLILFMSNIQGVRAFLQPRVDVRRIAMVSHTPLFHCNRFCNLIWFAVASNVTVLLVALNLEGSQNRNKRCMIIFESESPSRSFWSVLPGVICTWKPFKPVVLIQNVPCKSFINFISTSTRHWILLHPNG